MFKYKTSIVKSIVYEVEFESEEELSEDEATDKTIQMIEDNDYDVYIKNEDYFEFDIDNVEEIEED